MLTSISGLNNVTSIGGHLEINYNDAMTGISGLNNVTSIGEHLEINNNVALINLTGLESLTSIEGSLSIYNNASLTGISGLSNATSVENYLMIYNNPVLTGLTGLDNLETIGGNFNIQNNDVLASLTALDNLTSIGGYISIDKNNILTSLSGIDNVDAGTIEHLVIVHNTTLSTCEVQSICDYLSSPNGEVQIYGNAPGCNSPEEVEAACITVHIEEGNTIQNQFTLYPNPVSSNAKLSGEFASDGTVNICIYNTTGICLKSWQFANQQSGQQEFTLNLTELPRGIYFLRMQVGNEVVTKKVVKL